MNESDRFQQLKDLFHELVGIDEATRNQRLSVLAEEDPEQHAELLALLDLPSGVATREEALERLHEDTRRVADTGGGEAPPQIPDFEVGRFLGQGGMGRVYEAQQLAPVQRQVALKVMSTGLDSARVVARFTAERQALAVMNHPNIAQVYDAGLTTTNRPWFAMELVDGEPITDWADRHQLGLDARIELLLPVCSAVQHAHAKGVIHRDLKPSNLLVTEVGGRGVPKVVDFGIAKSIEQPLLAQSIATRFGELIGTPEYMSPEQASLGSVDVDTRSDVYSLGLVLFELLVGELPLPSRTLRGFAFDELCRRIREDDTPRPSERLISRDKTATTGLAASGEWIRRIRGDLDRVVLKALAKDREQRYVSAAELAADLERYLGDEPVKATPPSWGYRARKFVRRHTVATIAGGAVALALIAGLAAATLGLREARRSERLARAAETRAIEAQRTSEETSKFLVGLFQAADPRVSSGVDVTAGELLERGGQRIEQLDAEPRVQAALLETLGDVSWSLGAYERAEPLLERAIVLRSQGPAADPVRLAFALDRLGGLYRDRAEPEAAEKSHRRALAALETAGMGESSDTGRILNNLGIVLRRRGALDEAEAIYHRVIELTRRLEPEPSANLASSLTNLAAIQRERGEIRTARDTTLEALAQFEQLLPENHPNFSIIHGNLAVFNRALGELDRALDHAEQAVAVARAVLPSDHPDLAVSLHGLGAVRLRLGQIEQARSDFTESLAILEHQLGPDNFATALPRGSLGTTALASNDPATALRYLSETLKTLRASDHPRASRDQLGLLRQLAGAQRQLGRQVEAGATAREGFELAHALGRSEDQARFQLELALDAKQGGADTDAEAAWQAALLLAGCGEAPCELDRADKLAFRAMWWTAQGDFDRAFRSLEWAIDDVGWAATMLSSPELAPLQEDPRWAGLEARLERRVDGG